MPKGLLEGWLQGWLQGRLQGGLKGGLWLRGALLVVLAAVIIVLLTGHRVSTSTVTVTTASTASTSAPAAVSSEDEPEVDVLFQLAHVHMAVGDIDSAANFLRSAVEVAKDKPERASACYNFAKFLLGRPGSGNRSEIISLLKSAVDNAPHFADARHWLAHQLMRSPKGFAAALPHLEAVKLEELTDSHPLDTVMLLGQAYERSGNLKKATEAFGQGMELFYRQTSEERSANAGVQDRFSLAIFQLCRMLFLLGEYHQVADVARSSLESFPESYHLADVLALSLAKLGQKEDALSVYHHVLSRMVDWPPHYQSISSRVLGSTLALITSDQQQLGNNKDKDERSPELGVPSNDDGNGGWSSFQDSSGFSGHCNIDRRQNLTVRQFIDEYANLNRPVMITNVVQKMQTPEGVSLADAWSKEAFLQSYGHLKIEARKNTEVAYDIVYGVDREEMTIQTYVETTMMEESTNSEEPNGEDDRLYMFGDFGQAGSRIFHDVALTPDYFTGQFAMNETERQDTALFFLGSAGTGVSLHEHTNAWNLLVHGKKRWVLMPPYLHYGPVSLPLKEWMRDWYPKFPAGSVAQCTQMPGELLYVPTNWMHATWNIKASIGVAVEVGHNTELL